MEQPEVPPPGAGGRDQADGHHQRPAEVQGGHRRELVGQRVGLRRPAVDRRAVHLAGVDQTGRSRHPGRGEGDQQVQGERGARQHRQDPPGPQVVAGPAPVQPDEEERGRREVDGGVVRVGDAYQGVAVQQQTLHGGLVGQAQGALRVPDAVGVTEGRGRLTGGEQTAALVDEEESGDEEEFADERRPGSEVRPVLRGRRGTGCHAPAPLLTVWTCAGGCGRVGGRIDTPVYRYASVSVHWRIDGLCGRKGCPGEPSGGRPPSGDERVGRMTSQSRSEERGGLSSPAPRSPPSASASCTRPPSTCSARAGTRR